MAGAGLLVAGIRQPLCQEVLLRRPGTLAHELGHLIVGMLPGVLSVAMWLRLLGRLRSGPQTAALGEVRFALVSGWTAHAGALAPRLLCPLAREVESFARSAWTRAVATGLPAV